MGPAPIALFTYNRPEHLRRTIEHLAANILAPESRLFAYSDGPRSDRDIHAVGDVRTYLRTIRGFKQVSIIERDANFGLSKSVISGVSEVVGQFGEAIVLEDDMATSPFFLQYLNDALRFYRNEEQVISIHGYVYPLKSTLPETFFLRGADCWGWATWKRGWDLFEPDSKALLRELRSRDLQKEFDFQGTYPFTSMLKRQARGRTDSWAIRWHASAFLKNKLTLYPGTSLVTNIGLDSSGTHCSATDQFDVPVSTRPIRIEPIPLAVQPEIHKAFEDYFRDSRPSLASVAIRRLKKMFRMGGTCS